MRHLPVGNDQPEHAGAHQLERFASVAGGGDFVAKMAQVFDDDLARHQIIIDDQDAHICFRGGSQGITVA